MILEEPDFHGKGGEEALNNVKKNISWMIENDGNGFVFKHGKGTHGNKVAVVKQKVRRYLDEIKPELEKKGYRVIRGEEGVPISATWDEGAIIVVKAEYVNIPYGSGGTKQQEKNYIVRSEEGKELRKQTKKIKKKKRNKQIQRYGQLYGEYNSGVCSIPMAYDNFYKNNNDSLEKLENRASENADLVIENLLSECAVVCGKIFDISNYTIKIAPFYQDLKTVSALPDMMTQQLSPDIADYKLLHWNISDQIIIHALSKYLFACYSECKIEDLVLICKYKYKPEYYVNPKTTIGIIAFDSSTLRRRPIKKPLLEHFYVRAMLERVIDNSQTQSQTIHPKIIGKISLESYFGCAYRLCQVASELNVSKDAIVSFLKQKGWTIENSPNSKLTELMYFACLELKNNT